MRGDFMRTTAILQVKAAYVEMRRSFRHCVKTTVVYAGEGTYRK